MISDHDRYKSRLQTEQCLITDSQGFSQVYVLVKHLFSCIQKSCETVNKQTIQSLFSVFQSKRHAARKQAYFLFRETADILIFIACNGSAEHSSMIIKHLQKLMLKHKGNLKRALSGSLGSLPLKITGPELTDSIHSKIKPIEFSALLDLLGFCRQGQIRRKGRTLTIPLVNKKIACIKFATENKNIPQLLMEVRWLAFFQSSVLLSGADCHVPVPFLINSGCLFKITEIDKTGRHKPDRGINTDLPAIVFITDQTYYHYPNEPGFQDTLGMSALPVFEKSSRSAALLCTKGIVHTAIIPLFHNRVQRERRQDGGVYLWEHGGRLDRWLESSRYPNFASSGLRDFEHLESISKPGRLSHFIGEHLLGFILVAGSLFRNKASDLFGYDQNHKPYDVRHLFDPDLFYEMVQRIACNYYDSFTGSSNTLIKKLITKKLIEKLTDAMGIDRDMEEILRVTDQNHMSPGQFDSFLSRQGYDNQMKNRPVKGQRDIILNNGPHLGGFNQQIRVPELIDLLFSLSALCISDRYLVENGLKGAAN